MHEILTKLMKNGIHVWVDQGKLKYKSNKPLSSGMLNELKSNKTALIDFLIKANDSSKMLNQEIKIVDRSGTKLPMTYGQKSMWFLDQLSSGNPVFNIINAVKITGNLNKDALNKSVNDIVARHEILRAVFLNINGEPELKIKDNIEVKINEIDITSINEKIVKSKINEILKNESRELFSLSKGPLIRFTLITIDDNEYILSFTTNHIVSDAWSTNIFVNEFLIFYDAFIKQSKAMLPPLEIQYIDYADWQNKWLQTDDAKAKINYLKNQFKKTTPLEFAPDFPRPKMQSNEGGYESLFIQRDLLDSINSFCKKEGITLFVFLLTVFNILLHRYTGQDEIYTGTVVANRNMPGIDRLIGFFMNTLVLKTNIADEDSFYDTIIKNKKIVYNALANQEVPFDKLLEEIKVERDPGRTPLFQVMFILHNTQKTDLSIAGLEINEVKVESSMSPFDLRLQLTEDKDGLTGGFEYVLALFKPETIKRLKLHFCNILEHVTTRPGEKIKDIPILTEDEKNIILNQFNMTEESYPSGKTIHSFFEEAVKNTPGNTALIYNKNKLTYRELNNKANHAARILIDKGVKQDIIVGVMLERSAEMMIALFAVLKAGGAYLPIDPKFPLNRINYMIEDSGIDLIISVDKFKNIEITNKIEKINIDKIQYSANDLPDPLIDIKPGNLCYVIYTSGSTGNPKGTLISHDSLINRLHWMQKEYPLDNNDTILQKTPYTFDVSVWELFLWMMTGSKICFLQPDAEKDPAKIADAIEQNTITIMHFVPSMLEVFLEYLETNSTKSLSSLRFVIASGEALKVNHVERFYSIFKESNVLLANLYGPTEATIDVSFFNCQRNKKYRSIPIGKPIDNIELLIMDKNKNLQPIGVPGELCIGGAGLARGYLNRKELTTEKFINHPYKNGKKLYKTGDLARWLDNGNIEYMGRLDFQVKIRGLRIELGEIERQLSDYPGIKETVVIAGKDYDNNNYISAYYTAESRIEISELRTFLNKNLPAYMIPSYFTYLEKIPLTANGKVDRKSLPEAHKQGGRKKKYIAPQDDIEKKMASIWNEILKTGDKIGIDDNYYELGGDSLKIVRIINRFLEEGINININDFYLYGTIRELRQCVNTGEKSNYNMQPNNHEKKEITIDLLPPQYWFIHKLGFENCYNLHTFLYIKDGLNENLIEKAFYSVIDHHDSLRCLILPEKNTNTIEPHKTIVKQVIQKDHTKTAFFTLIDLKDTPSEELRDSIIKKADEVQEKINIITGPVCLMILFRTENGDHLFIVMHHLFGDNQSLEIILNDILTGYMQLLNGMNIMLTGTTTPLEYLTNKIQQEAFSDKILEDLPYWQNIKTNNEILPVDNNISLNQRIYKYIEKPVFEILEENELVSLRKIVLNNGLHLSELCMAVWGLSLKNVFNINSTSVSLINNGRNWSDPGINTVRTTGWFAFSYPVLINMNKTESVIEIAKKLKNEITNLPDNGRSFPILREIRYKEYPEKINLDFNFFDEILFIYYDEVYAQNQEVTNGITISPYFQYKGNFTNINTRFAHKYSVDLFIKNNKLGLIINFNNQEYNQETILKIAETYKKILISFINE